MANKKNQNEKVFQFLIIVLGTTVLWLWIGFVFLATSTLYFLASVLIGLWLGLLMGIYEVTKEEG